MKPVKIPGFTGINNRAPSDRLPKDEAGKRAVRDAVNVDLTDAGQFQRRPGIARVEDAPNCRSLFNHGPWIYYATDNELRRFDGESSFAVSEIASVLAPVCYVPTPMGLVWSDTFSNSLIRGNTSAMLTVPAPNPAPAVVTQAGGALKAGMYAVCFAAVMADGRRSAFTEPSFVYVSDNERIRLTMAPLLTNVDVFVTAPDGDVFYRDRTLPIGTVSQDLSIITSSGEPVVYEVLAPLPAGNRLAFHNGRLLSAKGAFAWYSKPYNYAIHRPHRDYLALDEDITLMASVDGGLYLASASSTYFLPGADMAQANLVKVANYGAVPGTLATVPNSTDLTWFSSRGQVRADTQGAVALLQDKQIAFDPASSGASIYRESNGLRTLITALQGKRPTAAASFGSYMDATVIKP